MTARRFFMIPSPLDRDRTIAAHAFRARVQQFVSGCESDGYNARPAAFIRINWRGQVGKGDLMIGAARALVAAAILSAAIFATVGPLAAAAETVNFGTDWKAQAEHGGFYQAIATGIYERYGLDVRLRPGGPQVNHSQLLAAGVLDFNIASNSFVPLNYVQQNVPMIAVAAIFQKDPSVLIAHSGQGSDNLASLKGK